MNKFSQGTYLVPLLLLSFACSEADKEMLRETGRTLADMAIIGGLPAEAEEEPRKYGEDFSLPYESPPIGYSGYVEDGFGAPDVYDRGISFETFENLQHLKFPQSLKAITSFLGVYDYEVGNVMYWNIKGSTSKLAVHFDDFYSFETLKNERKAYAYTVGQ